VCKLDPLIDAISTHLTLEALAGTASQGIAVAVGNGMIDLLHGGCAGGHASLAQLHQLSDWLDLGGWQGIQEY